MQQNGKRRTLYIWRVKCTQPGKHYCLFRNKLWRKQNTYTFKENAIQGIRTNSRNLLYSAVYRDLYKFAFYTIGNSEQAKDAVSETFLDAYKGIGKLKNTDK